MSLSVSGLRSNIYKLLDNVLATGKPLEIERKGKKLAIIPEETRNKFSNIKKHDVFLCDPEEIVHMDWSKEWNSDLP